jgi:hypothetical protein
MPAPIPPRVLTIFVRAGTTAYPDSETHLDRLYATQLPALPRDVLVVDNLLPPGVAEAGESRVVIGGDNSAWEFSAIDAAVAHLGPSIWRYDLVNIVTSAFEQLYVAYLDRFVPPVVASITGRRVCVGHIDCYNEPVHVHGCRSQHWLRSCFLMLPVAELMALGTCVSARDRGQWFSARVDQPFAGDAPLCERFQKYISDWLLGQDIGQGVTWHRTLVLDMEGLAVFEQKALAILNEHLLGIRMRAAGCRLIDVTWLSAQLAAGHTPAWDTPWWEQLARRDRDARQVGPGPAGPERPYASSMMGRWN